jgi:AraC family transcriptional regulator
MSIYSAEKNAIATPGSWVDYRDCINRVTSYIHGHINGELHLEHLASLAGFSPFHFHRVFAALMGETVAEYVHRMRLGAAVQQLLHSNESVTEIALAVGYKTPAAFTKAFRQRFGIVPTALRTMDRAAAYALLMKQPPVNRLKTRRIRPEIRILPDQYVLYARRTGMIDQTFNQAAAKAFTSLMTYLEDHELQDKWTVRVGIAPDDPNVVPHDQCRYDAGVILRGASDSRRYGEFPPYRGLRSHQVETAVRDFGGDVRSVSQDGLSVQLSGEADLQVLPGGRWVVFQHKGPYETLWQTWTTVGRDWLPRSGEIVRDMPPVEIYLDDARKTPPEALRTEILIPII